MYPRTPAFDVAMRDSLTVVASVDVYQGAELIASDLPVLGGVVRVDGSALIRRRVDDLIVADADGALIPVDADDPLAPYGQTLVIKRGVRYWDGTTELLPIATLRIGRSQVLGMGEVRVSGYDAMRAVQRARFERPYVIAPSTNIGTAVKELLISRVPTFDLSQFTETVRTTPASPVVFDQGDDPAARAVELAASVGFELFIDPSGRPVFRPESNPAVLEPVWQLIDGPGSTLLDVTVDRSDEPGYNGAVVDGEPPGGAPVQSVIYDTDPTSPTNANGPYGKVPRFLRSTLIATKAQADEAALGMLLREKGGTEQFSGEAIPHPAWESGDLHHVRDQAKSIDVIVTLESFTMPLDVRTPSTLTWRKRRTAT